MKTKTVYNITWYKKAPAAPEEDDILIDLTQLDENNDELIWGLFKEFGHERTDQTYYEIDEEEEELTDEEYEFLYGNINIE